MGKTEAGLLLLIESAARTAARWRGDAIPHAHAAAVVEAAHGDLLANLARLADATLYLAPLGPDDAEYTGGLAGQAGCDALELPDSAGLQRWDSALSILYNRCHHPKVFCADGQVPDLYADDLDRARRKLELYEVVVGREGEDGCWLIGMHGYSEFLERVQPQREGLLHALLEAGVERGQQISVLDTKQSLRSEPDLAALRYLAKRPDHPVLRRTLGEAGMLVAPTPPEA